MKQALCILLIIGVVCRCTSTASGWNGNLPSVDIPSSQEDHSQDERPAGVDFVQDHDVSTTEMSVSELEEIDTGSLDVREPLSFELEELSAPISRNILPGVLTIFARYQGNPHGADITSDRLRVRLQGSLVNVDYVAVVTGDRRVLGNASPRADDPDGVEIDLGATPLRFPRDRWTLFMIVAVMKPVVARASTIPLAPAAHSGGPIRMMLASGETTGWFDAHYAYSYNIRLLSEGSAETLYAASGTLSSPNFMIVRRSIPTITSRVTTTPAPIVEGRPTVLYGWQIEASEPGSIAWKKMTFRVDMTGTVSVNQFQLMRDDLHVPNDHYEIVDGEERSLRDTISLVSPLNFVTIRWMNEDVVERGTIRTYRLLAVPSGVRRGDMIQIQPLRSGMSLPGTGWLTENMSDLRIGGFNIAGPSFIDIVLSTGVAEAIPGAFLWSDLAETPHRALPFPLGSMDWTSDEFLEGLEGTQTLTGR